MTIAVQIFQPKKLHPDCTARKKGTNKISSHRRGAGKAITGRSTTLSIIYSCGDFTAATHVVRSDDKVAMLKISRNASLPSNGFDAFFRNPFADLKKSKNANIRIENALITPVPSTANGWTIAVAIFVFIGFFASGPGVCVWIALSELMPTRIRSNG
jgi:hypothetical protein